MHVVPGPSVQAHLSGWPGGSIPLWNRGKHLPGSTPPCRLTKCTLGSAPGMCLAGLHSSGRENRACELWDTLGDLYEHLRGFLSDSIVINAYSLDAQRSVDRAPAF